jgi:thiol:disulfide interchange protein DsbC
MSRGQAPAAGGAFTGNPPPAMCFGTSAKRGGSLCHNRIFLVPTGTAGTLETMKLDAKSFALGLLVAVTASCAGDYNGTGKSVSGGSLKEKLETAVGQAPEDIRPAQDPGVLEARWGSNFAYITPDGRYVIFGDMFDLETREEVTENVRRKDRLEALSGLGADNTIEFAPAKTKYTVTVFTDVDCGYCRMLHRQMDQYHAKGIAIRYLFFPRSGPGTDSFRKAEAVWCADDRHAALTQAKNAGDYHGPTDCPNPVRREFELAMKLGVRGTPLLILPNGDTIPGYVPAEQLSAQLENNGRPVETARN